MALQFLSTLFTQETKYWHVGATVLERQCTAALSDVVNGPSANQLCELLMQVCGHVGLPWSWSNQSIQIKNQLCVLCPYLMVNARVLKNGPFRTL